MRDRRPRQAKDTEDDDEESDASDSDTVTNSATNKRARRHRGGNKRQRIQDDSDDDIVTDTTINSEQLPSTRRRGRPHKRTISRPADDSDELPDTEDAEQDIVTDTTINSEQLPSTRRRGRPRKRTISMPGDDSDENTMMNGTSLNGETSSPRRRGRPPRRTATRPLDDSDDNGSPQPSTSGLNLFQRNGIHDSDSSESSGSGSETPDSDYMLPEEKNKKKRGRPVRACTRNKKQKVQNNYSTSAVQSNKDSRGLNKVNQSAVVQSNKVSRSLNSVNRSAVHTKAQKENVSLDPTYIEALAHKCVYFLLIEDQKKYAIKRKAIVTHVFRDEDYSPKLYSNVILKANTILMKTFGMELMELENQRDSYLLVNILKRELSIDEFIELPRLKHQQQGLILYLLTIIFMNNNCITEDELTKALKPLNIDYTSKKPHAVFGDVKSFISKELVKQMYLNFECINKDPPQYEITWGLRAKEEVDKRDLLQFACRIMDDTSPESWILQYKDAEESASPE